LQEMIEPFKEQLESFELEKKALLSRSEQAQGEVKKLATQYGALLGTVTSLPVVTVLFSVADPGSGPFLTPRIREVLKLSFFRTGNNITVMFSRRAKDKVP
jgi:Hyaluronan mediated motility receptor C-terminal